MKEKPVPPKCKMCDNLVKRNWAAASKWATYCSCTCRANDPELTSRLVDNDGKSPLNSKKSKEKRKQTCIGRYGSEYPLQSEGIRDKGKATNIERYGVEWSFHSEEIKEKMKATMIERHGVEYSGQSPLLLEKQRITNLERHGIEHPIQSEEIYNKMKATNLERWGTEHYNQKHLVDILPLLNDKEWMVDQYNTKNKTSSIIGEELDCYYGTVCNYLRKHSIELKRGDISYSISACYWLNSIIEQEGIIIHHALNDGEFKIPGTKYYADGYCAATNTVYEYHGSVWHGNPRTNVPHPKDSSITAEELYKKTKEREQAIIELGYNLVVMWDDGFTYSYHHPT